MSGSSKVALAFGVPILVLSLIQLIPYGRQHTNPGPERVVAWNSSRTQDLARRACFDCHSNETRWPWYSSIAPVSWRIQTHVNEGRKKLNFSAFAPANEKVAHAAGEAGETITKGEMPPVDYVLMHPEARLSWAEKNALAQGLDVTFAAFVESGQRQAETRGTVRTPEEPGEGEEREHRP